MKKKWRPFSIIALAMVFFLVFQTGANSIVLTSTFLAGATFLATNAGVIIPACAVVVVMAGAAIAVWDVVDRIFGRNTNTTTGTAVVQALANSAMGLSRGVGGVTSLASAGRTQLLSGSFDSNPTGLLNTLQGISGQADTVRMAMDSQLASAQSQMAYSDACDTGLNQLQDLSEPRVSSVAAAAALVQRGIATAAGSFYKATLESRRKWLESTKDLRAAISKLKRDTAQGIGQVGHTIKKRVDSILDEFGKTGNAIRDDLDRIRKKIQGIGATISQNLQNLREKIVFSSSEISEMRRQYANIENAPTGSRTYRGSSSGQVMEVASQETETATVATGAVAASNDQEFMDTYSQYRSAYREYYRLATENPESEETKAAYRHYKELYSQMTGSGAQTNGATNTVLAPALERTADSQEF